MTVNSCITKQKQSESNVLQLQGCIQEFEEIVRENLINYYLDTKNFEPIKELLSENWRSFIYSNEVNGNIWEHVEEMTDNQKRYVLDFYLYSDSSVSEELINLLFENLKKVQFIREDSKIPNVPTVADLNLEQVSSLVEKGEDIFILLEII